MCNQTIYGVTGLRFKLKIYAIYSNYRGWIHEWNEKDLKIYFLILLVLILI